MSGPVWSREPIRRISTIRNRTLPNLLWVKIEGTSGAEGLGETLYHPGAVEAFIHEAVAPALVGRDANDIAGIWADLYRGWCRSGIGAEARAASAIDVALWDLLGIRSSLPLWQLLGGRSRADLPVYNTCAGPGYVRSLAVVGQRWAATADDADHDDLWASEHEPVELARSLLAQGITAMKVWPFDGYAAATGGLTITPADIDRALRPVMLIREALGRDMGIAIELHNLWSLPAARSIAHALEPLEPLWLEDPLPMDDLDAVARLADSTRVPILASETLGSRFPYRELLARGAASIVATDSSWVGGISEARRVADLAAAYRRPFTHHDCSGPVNLAVGVHLSTSAEGGFTQEIVRSHYSGWYQETAEGLPTLADGRMEAPGRPGHGVRLRPSFLAEAGTRLRTTPAAR